MHYENCHKLFFFPLIHAQNTWQRKFPESFKSVSWNICKRRKKIIVLRKMFIRFYTRVFSIFYRKINGITHNGYTLKCCYPLKERGGGGDGNYAIDFQLGELTRRLLIWWTIKFVFISPICLTKVASKKIFCIFFPKIYFKIKNNNTNIFWGKIIVWHIFTFSSKKFLNPYMFASGPPSSSAHQSEMRLRIIS